MGYDDWCVEHRYTFYCCLLNGNLAFLGGLNCCRYIIYFIIDVFNSDNMDMHVFELNIFDIGTVFAYILTFLFSDQLIVLDLKV